jgi:hypothetical protein
MQSLKKIPDPQYACREEQVQGRQNVARFMNG